MYEYCDLKWGSITVTGLFALLLGLAALMIPPHAAGLLVTLSASLILVLGGILLAEGLFLDGRGLSALVVTAMGLLGVFLAIAYLVYPGLIITTAGTLIGISLVIFGLLMVFATAVIAFDFFIRAIVVVSSFFAIIIGVYFIFFPVTSLALFTLAVGVFLILYGIIRMAYGIRLREWQKTCPADFRKKA